MIQISQQRHKCIGCNACVEIDPYRWRITKNDGKSVLVGAREKSGWFICEVGDDEKQLARDAERVCPVNIIHVRQL